MAKLLPRDKNGNPEVGIFQNTALFYGSLIGAVAGTAIASPYFSEWSLGAIVLTIAASAVTVGLLAMCAVAFAALEAKSPYHVVDEHPATRVDTDVGD